MIKTEVCGKILTETGNCKFIRIHIGYNDERYAHIQQLIAAAHNEGKVPLQPGRDILNQVVLIGEEGRNRANNTTEH
ncbi:hypothetical protein D3C78_1845560 [compost metagenome]